MRTAADLRKGQRRAANFIMRVKRCALFLDMGFGKTISVLSIIGYMQDRLLTRRWLVVAPLRVARDTWIDEIHDWQHVAHLELSKAIGDPYKRSQALLDPRADIISINVENLEWLEMWLRNNKLHLKNFPFDGIVLDESTKFKDSSTRRWRVARRLSKKCRFFVLLTGTPAPEQLYNLQPQIELLDGGKRLGASFIEFRREHYTQMDYYATKWEIKPGHDEIIMKAIADICMVPDPEDYIELPPLHIIPVPVKLSAADRDKYNELEKKYVLHLTNGGLVEAASSAALTTKLQQMANGCVYENFDDGTRVAHYIHDAKIDALREIVDEVDGIPLIVAYTFKTDLARLQQAFPQGVVFDTSDGIKERWNRREIPILFVSPKSAAHGLNVQFGGNLIVWFGLTYSYEQWIQLIKRLWRSGQRELNVIVKVLMVENSIDEVAYWSCTTKGKRQGEFLDKLRDYIRTKRIAA